MTEVVNSGLNSTKSSFSHFKLPSSNANFSGLNMKNFKCRGCFGNSKTSPITWNHFQIFKIKSRDTGALWSQEDGFYVHYLGKNYWFGEVFVEQLNGHHETFEAQSIKLIISGEMPIGPESHQDSWFWSNKQLFSDGYCERPCKSWIFIVESWISANFCLQ